MSKTVLFYGNCQAQALGDLYRNQIARRRDENVSLVFLGGELKGQVARADVVVEQVFDSHEPIVAADLKAGAKWFRFPMVLGTFIWPFASQAHVQNESYPFLTSGPYPAELGDNYLNRLIGRVPFGDAITRYMELDVPAHVHLDRLYEISMASQRERDKISKIDVTALIEQNFRNEPLFLTRGHPTRRIFDHIASTLFENMGIPGDDIRLALGSYIRSPFPWDELPVHPSVIAHYGLKYLSKDYAYRYMDEGRLTFEEYVSRYLRYEWNIELYRGIQLARRQDQGPEAALRVLEKGLAKSPQSESGLRAKCNLLFQMGRLAEAREAAASVVSVDPENPENHSLLGWVLLHLGDLALAEQTFRHAIALHPLGAKHHKALADVLSRMGRNQEAVDTVRFTVPLLPGDADIHGLLGLVLQRNSDLDAAETAFRQAILLAPKAESYQSYLADVLAQKERDAAAA